MMPSSGPVTMCLNTSIFFTPPVRVLESQGCNTLSTHQMIPPCYLPHQKYVPILTVPQMPFINGTLTWQKFVKQLSNGSTL